MKTKDRKTIARSGWGNKGETKEELRVKVGKKGHAEGIILL